MAITKSIITLAKITFFKTFSRNPCQFQKEIVTLWCGI